MGENINIIGAIIVMFCILVSVFGALCMYYFLRLAERQKKMLVDQHLAASRFREELLRSVLEMQEHTFQSVSRDIHDNVGQLLSLAKLNLNNLIHEIPGHEKLVAVKDLVTRAIVELREIANAYNGEPLLQSGVLPAIQSLLEQMKRTGNYQIIFSSEVDHITLSKNHSILLYRVIQETLTNIIRHANATEIEVQVREQSGKTMISIRDDGKGFVPGAPRFQAGIGLKSMHERTAMIGARLEIRAAINSGTEIIITLKENA